MTKINKNNEDIDFLIGKKMAEKLQEEMEAADVIPEFEVITDIDDVPKELIFSHSAIYLLFNRINKTKTFITGEQAEAFIGIAHDIKRNMLSKSTDNFTLNEYYVKFYQIKIQKKK